MNTLQRLFLLTCTTMAVTPSPAAQPSSPAVQLTQVASFDHQVTGITVSEKGRIFVNFPRWTEDSAVSVAELKDGKLVPYPDGTWNEWRNARKDELDASKHWVCVQSVVADGKGSLWVIDPAAPAMAAVVPEGPKLVKISLQSDKVERVYALDPSIATQGSYMNDVRISPDGSKAYLTDSGAKGALVVVDLASGQARRVLDGHPSTQPDKSVVVHYDDKPLRRPDGRGVEFSADGIELSPDGKTLYWQAIKGKTLYALEAKDVDDASLDDAALAKKIQVVGENGPADGIIIRPQDGMMYVTSPQDDAVKRRDLGKPGSPLETVVQDKRLRWPDTFSVGPDGTLYLTTSRIQDSAMFKADAPAALPTQLWALKFGTRP